MALKKLEDQIKVVEDQIREAQLDPCVANMGMVAAEFRKLKFILEGLSSYVEHRWQVRLFGMGWVSELADIHAEHLEGAREKASNMVDEFDAAIRYELYCDGKLIPEED